MAVCSSGSVIIGRSIRCSIGRPSRVCQTDSYSAWTCSRSGVPAGRCRTGAGSQARCRQPARFSAFDDVESEICTYVTAAWSTLVARVAATAPQSVARPSRSDRSEIRTPRVRATGRTSTRTGSPIPFRPTAPCRPKNTHAPTHRPPTPWPLPGTQVDRRHLLALLRDRSAVRRPD